MTLEVTVNLGIMVHVRVILTNTMLKSLWVCPFVIGKYPWETPGNVFGVSREGGGKREEAFGLRESGGSRLRWKLGKMRGSMSSAAPGSRQVSC